MVSHRWYSQPKQLRSVLCRSPVDDSLCDPAKKPQLPGPPASPEYFSQCCVEGSGGNSGHHDPNFTGDLTESQLDVIDQLQLDTASLSARVRREKEQTTKPTGPAQDQPQSFLNKKYFGTQTKYLIAGVAATCFLILLALPSK